jgi:uncharacterized caspase-like protein
MAVALKQADFQVQLVENADARNLERAVQEFAGAILPGDVGLFYYSGHGMQIGNTNYLVPTDFAAVTETDARFRAFSVDRILETMQERGARLKILVLDACRDNPFGTSRSGAKGLASMSTGRGSFIAFATDPGKTADDNPSGANGLFTKYLIGALSEPGLRLEEVFNRAREGVEKDSGGHQVPWSVSSVLGEFSFHPLPAPVAPASPTEQTNLDIAFWNSIKDSKDPLLYQAYLRRFPNGLFREVAEIRAKAPVAQTQAPAAQSATAISTTEVRTFIVKHWRQYNYSDKRLSSPVNGRLWIGSGKVDFVERGEGQRADDNFSLTCSDILEVKSYRQSDKSPFFDILFGKKDFSFTVDPLEQRDEIVSLINTMCESSWFNRAAAQVRKKQ